MINEFNNAMFKTWKSLFLLHRRWSEKESPHHLSGGHHPQRHLICAHFSITVELLPPFSWEFVIQQ